MRQTDGERKAAAMTVPPGWAWVKTLDGAGKVLEEKWEYRRPPDRYATDGLSHLGPYIDQLLGSTNWFSSLTIVTLDDELALAVWHNEGRIELHDFFFPKQLEVEQAARSLAQASGYRITTDYLADDRTRILAWELPKDKGEILQALTHFACQVRGLPEDAGLKISFEEHKDNRERFSDCDQISFISTYPRQDPAAPAPQ